MIIEVDFTKGGQKVSDMLNFLVGYIVNSTEESSVKDCKRLVVKQEINPFYIYLH